MEYGNIFYFNNINAIGGVETFFYYLAKKYQDYDITIFYSNGDEEQIKRLKKYVRVKKYNGERIKCKKAFFNYNPVIIDKVDAEEYIQVIHADYKAQPELSRSVHPKITKIIGVSKLVSKTFEEVTGRKVDLCYNPVEIDEPKEPILIVSATRLNENVKGKENIVKIGKMLDDADLPYLWLIFTNDTNAIKNPNIIYMKPKLDITNYLKKADIVAQLSNSESFGFTPNEALKLGTPVLLMDLPIWKELNIKDGVHGWIIKDIDSFDVNKLYKKLPSFKYEPPKDRWDKFLASGNSTYKEDLKIMVSIKCVTTYDDLKLKRRIIKDEIIEVNKVRADELINDYGYCEEVKEDGNI